MGLVLSRRQNVFLLAAILAAVALRSKLRSDKEDFLRLESPRPTPGSVLGNVSALTIFPVKSCRGISVSSVRVTRNGMDFDRVIMIVNKKKTPITQRMIPQLAQVKISLFKDAQTVTVEPPQNTNVEPLELRLDSELGGNEVRVDVFSLPVDCVDYGEEAAQWLDKMLTGLTGKPKSGYRFVRIQAGEARRIHTSAARLLTKDTQPHDGTYLSDLAPLTLTAEGSLRKLNDNIPEDVVPMDRFRSNIVVNTKRELAFVEGKCAKTFVEQCAIKKPNILAKDECSKVQLGALDLRVIGPTFRCVMPSVCQKTGEAGFRKNIREAEPIATLKKHRSGGLRYGLSGMLPVTMGGSTSLAPIFGVYLGVQNKSDAAEIKLGDKFVVQQY